MRFISLRNPKTHEWRCILFVKRWRPFYDRLNAILAQSKDERVQFVIVPEEEHGTHALR